MGKVKDKLYGISPAWLCRLGYWVKVRPYRIKYWFQRANGQVPAIDCWEFNDTIASTIEQGLSWMLYKGCSATWNHREGSELKQRSDLIFVKNVMSDFLRYHYEDYGLIHDPKVWEQHEKNLHKAFGILARYFWGLWD